MRAYPGLTLNALPDAAQNFLAEDSGATAIEYALLASLLAVFLIFGLNALGSRLNNVFSEVSSALN